MTQQEVLEHCRQERPDGIFVPSKDGNAVGGWDKAKGRFVMVVSRAISGEWVACRYELLINGAPPYSPDRWQV